MKTFVDFFNVTNRLKKISPFPDLYFQASYMILDDEDDFSSASKMADNPNDLSHNSSVPSFPRPEAREYILRTIIPRPAPYSKQLPQRMYSSIEEDEFRLAGAFASDSVFR